MTYNKIRLTINTRLDNNKDISVIYNTLVVVLIPVFQYMHMYIICSHLHEVYHAELPSLLIPEFIMGNR